MATFSQETAALRKAHLHVDPDWYAGHSFTIVAATVEHAQGVDDPTIMTLGRWKSNAYKHYIKIPHYLPPLLLIHVYHITIPETISKTKQVCVHTGA